MDILGINNKLDELTTRLDRETSNLTAKVGAMAAALETQTAKDVKSITDGLVAAILPEVAAVRASIDQAVLVINASVTEVTALVRRIDGAQVTVKLGPES